MLRQSATENKAQKVSDSITDSDGKVYRKSDYESPAMPGRTRPGMLFSSFELRCCAEWGLVAPSGFDFRAHIPVERPRDPSHVSRADVPAPLLEAAAKAWAKLEEVRGRIAAALERRDEAERAWRRAARDQNARVYNRELAASLTAEEERKSLEAEEPPLRQKVSRAEEMIRRWMVDEGMYRSGAAERPQPVVF